MDIIRIFEKVLRWILEEPEERQQREFQELYKSWRIEREERNRAIENNIRSWLVNILEKDGGLHYTTEGGNDESLVMFEAFNDERNEYIEDLTEYLIVVLNIPSAGGEGERVGEGKLYIKDGSIHTEYSSVYRLCIDYNEQTDEATWEERDRENYDSPLFTV